MLSDDCREIYDKQNISVGGVKKLVKNKHVCHYRNLQLYLQFIFS